VELTNDVSNPGPKVRSDEEEYDLLRPSWLTEVRHVPDGGAVEKRTFFHGSKEVNLWTSIHG
jgi:hypothetical protein